MCYFCCRLILIKTRILNFNVDWNVTPGYEIFCSTNWDSDISILVDSYYLLAWYSQLTCTVLIKNQFSELSIQHNLIICLTVGRYTAIFCFWERVASCFSFYHLNKDNKRFLQSPKDGSRIISIKQTSPFLLGIQACNRFKLFMSLQIK